MKISEITKILKDKGFEVFSIKYITREDQEKYGESFDAECENEFKFVKVNKGEFKAKRIIEEYGSIVFIYNGEQVSFKKEDIDTFEVL